MPAAAGTLKCNLDYLVGQVAVVDSETTTCEPEELEFQAKDLLVEQAILIRLIMVQGVVVVLQH